MDDPFRHLGLRGIEAAHASDLYALRVVAREARTGRLIASAELSLAQSAIRADLRKPPENFEQYLRDSEKLEAGEYVSGNLRIDVRTNKGSRGLLFESGEEMSLFVRVNQPAWVKLVYVLASGDHVPIDQAWFIDGEKANQFSGESSARYAAPDEARLIGSRRR